MISHDCWFRSLLAKSGWNTPKVWLHHVISLDARYITGLFKTPDTFKYNDGKMNRQRGKLTFFSPCGYHSLMNSCRMLEEPEKK